MIKFLSFQTPRQNRKVCPHILYSCVGFKIFPKRLSDNHFPLPREGGGDYKVIGMDFEITKVL
jgi:hypothetical protein